MQAHQERVVTENAELREKIHKLGAFVAGAVYPTLSVAEQVRLCRQLVHMEAYAAVLTERIAAF